MDGKIGACPKWYADAQAAKWLGIPVPDIIHVPLWWIDRAHIGMSAEHEGQKIKAQHQK